MPGSVQPEIAFSDIHVPGLWPGRFRHLIFAGERTAAPESSSAPRKKSVRERRPQSVTLDPASAAFFDSLCRNGGLRAARYRGSILLRRQAACLRALRAPDAARGSVAINRDPEGAGRALGAVMIGVTSFFRDAAVFDTLGGLLGPLHRARGSIEALSVGCSDGSELYSLAILLAEQGLLADAKLWGLDCRPEAIRTAAAGIYPAQAARSVPENIRARCFAATPGVRAAPGMGGDGPGVRIADPLRAACRFAVADAFVLPPEPPLADIIMCRNLVIYLTAQAAAELWALLVARLRPGGLLVVGKAERPPADVCEHLARIAPCIYRRITAQP